MTVFTQCVLRILGMGGYGFVYSSKDIYWTCRKLNKFIGGRSPMIKTGKDPCLEQVHWVSIKEAEPLRVI